MCCNFRGMGMRFRKVVNGWSELQAIACSPIRRLRMISSNDVDFHFMHLSQDTVANSSRTTFNRTKIFVRENCSPSTTITAWWWVQHFDKIHEWYGWTDGHTGERTPRYAHALRMRHALKLLINNNDMSDAK